MRQALVGSLLLCGIALAFQENSRQLWDTVFQQSRPADGRALAKPPARAATPGTRPAMLGVTLWKLRPAGNSTAGARLLVQPGRGEAAAAYVAERMSAGAGLREKDRVRLSVESPVDGYLYVFDREQYAGGKIGAAALIFPTRRARGGDNHVTAGKVIEIPAQDDHPPYFEMQPGSAQQMADLITLIMTREPIPGFVAPEDRQLMRADEVAAWESKWGGRTERLELPGGAGKLWTAAEQQAGGNTGRMLVQGDPLPQTIFHAAEGNGAIVVQLPLRIAR